MGRKEKENMEYNKIGNLICKLRKEKGYTQKQLADKMHLSDRTISKWERGVGLPDISLLSELANFLEINVEEILKGEIFCNELIGGNMKQMKYYICKTCGNIVMSTGNASVSCCGKKMQEEIMKKAAEEEKLKIEEIDGQWYISSNHSMEKTHYISFIAFATGDKLQIIKQYPEWDMQASIPKREHGKLIWYCTNHGMFYQLL